MSEVEKLADSEVNDEGQQQQDVSSEDAAEKDATSSEHSSKTKDPKGNVLDVFKQFASSTGPSWADMMIEEAATVETEKHKQRLEEINKEIHNLKEPFIVYVSKLSSHVTAEDIYYFFGGNDSVCDVFRFNEGRTGEALVELKSLDSLRDALMKNETDFFKEKVNIEYVDACYNRCYPIPRPKSNQSSASQYHHQERGQYNRGGANRDRDNKHHRNDRRGGDRGVPNRYQQDNRSSRHQQQQSNDVRLTSKNHHQIPSLFNNGNMPKPPPVEPQRSVEPAKQVEPRGPRPSPFGLAKPVDKTSEVMREVEEKILNEKKSEKIVAPQVPRIFVPTKNKHHSKKSK